jgi:hypothetical protein
MLVNDALRTLSGAGNDTEGCAFVWASVVVF